VHPANRTEHPQRRTLGRIDLEAVWPAKAVYRVERAKDPAHPQIVFLSNAVECAALKDEGFEGRIMADMIWLELGAAATGVYRAQRSSPPPATSAYIYHYGSYTPPNPPSPSQYSMSGEVNVTFYDSTAARGTFYADFVTEPPAAARVCGRLDAKPCAVNW
jgi:hypothetical protein